MAKRSREKYYSASGAYLKEHQEFLKIADVKLDVDFLIKALAIKKDDRTLDIACGQGRHAIEFTKRGYGVDGVDYSKFLIDKAKTATRNLQTKTPDFYLSNIIKTKLPGKYSKAYWFFPDFADIDIPAALKSINQSVETGGMVLLDTDNIYRLVSFLQRNPSHKDNEFDVKTLKLLNKKDGSCTQYQTFPVWKKWLESNNFSIQKIFGDYELGPYSVHSPRLIFIITKPLRPMMA